MTGAGTPWLLRPPRPDSAARLFCFPFAGVGASLFRRWPSHLGPLEVCPVQPPGRENRMREATYLTFEDFADDVAAALAVHCDRPFALFGHCMGALLAFALLVRLEALAMPVPVRLIVSSALVPHAGPFGPFRPSMSDVELGDELTKILRSMGEPEPIPDLLALSTRILRRDVEMCEGYRPQGPRSLPCPITTIGWSEDPYVEPEKMDSWREYGTVSRHLVAGDGFGLVGAPPALLAAIEQDLAGEIGRREAPSDAG